MIKLKKYIHILQSILPLVGNFPNMFKKIIRIYFNEGFAGFRTRLMLFSAMTNPQQLLKKNLQFVKINKNFPLYCYINKHPVNRITLFLDLFEKEYTDAVMTGLLYGAFMASKRALKLRIISRGNALDIKTLYQLFLEHQVEIKHELEILTLANNHSHEIEAFESECFITTSWLGTEALLETISPQHIIYLIQEDERRRYPYNAMRLRCEKVQKHPDIQLVFRTYSLYQHFKADNLYTSSKSFYGFEPILKQHIMPSSSKNQQHQQNIKRTLVIYAEPLKEEYLFSFTVELIEKAILRGIIDVAEWHIIFYGASLPDLKLVDNYQPSLQTPLNQQTFIERFCSVDLVISFNTVKPVAFPVMDLLGYGVVLLTNNFEPSFDPTRYSPNLLSGTLDISCMLEQLVAAIALARDDERRQANVTVSSSQETWSSTFNALLKVPYLEAMPHDRDV